MHLGAIRTRDAVTPVKRLRFPEFLRLRRARSSTADFNAGRFSDGEGGIRGGELPAACLCAVLFLLLFASGQAMSQEAAAAPVDDQTLVHIRDAAMTDDWAWRQLAELTDSVGPRLSGSSQLELAVDRVATLMRRLGATVTLQPAKVPHWVRGEERAELVEFAGRGAGLAQRLSVTALGASGATAPAGLTARVVVVHDFEELQRRASDIPGNIVVYAAGFDQNLAENGKAGAAYGQAGKYRFVGPAKAAELGAAAALVRSVGGANYRLPHTGQTGWKDGQAPIPAGALAAEDAELIERLAARGPLTMHLVLTPQTLPDANSNNVIADWPGRESPEDVVLVSGHLDSWDLGTGASDDGVGVMAAAGVIEVLQRLHLHARRTIRFVGWTNEENGQRGSAAYFADVSGQVAHQTAAIESDAGAGRPLGLLAAVTPESMARLRPLMHAMEAIGAGVLERRDTEMGTDIEPLQTAGVPGFAPLVDTRHYFDIHHTAADTIDKIDPRHFQAQVAVLAMLAYYLAEMPEPMARFAVPK